MKAGREACALSRQLRLGEHKGAGEPQAQPHCPITQPALRSSQSCPNGPHLVPLASHFLPASYSSIIWRLVPRIVGGGPPLRRPRCSRNQAVLGSREGATAGRGRPGGLGILTKVCLPTGPHHRPPRRHEAVSWQPRSLGPSASLGSKPSRAPQLAGAMKVRLPPPPAPSTWLLPAGKGFGPPHQAAFIFLSLCPQSLR